MDLFAHPFYFVLPKPNFTISTPLPLKLKNNKMLLFVLSNTFGLWTVMNMELRTICLVLQCTVYFSSLCGYVGNEGDGTLQELVFNTVPFEGERRKKKSVVSLRF